MKFARFFFLLGMIILPSMLMIFVYTKIVIRSSDGFRRSGLFTSAAKTLQLRNRQQEKSEGHVDRPSNSSLRRLTKIACAASTIVVVCWLPDQLYFTLFQLDLIHLREKIHNSLIILAFINTVINPFLYCLSDKRYVREIVKCFPCFRRRVRQVLPLQESS